MTVIGMVLAGGLGKRMGGDKPKVLYEVRGIPMVSRAVAAVREGGVDRLCAVLSHRSDEVAAVLADDVEVVVQDEPRGTASAILATPHHLEDPNNIIVVSFGDMPWLNSASVSRLIETVQDGADGAVLTFHFDDPPHFGRILRDDKDRFVDIRQFKDCSEQQKAIHELDAGMFAFRAKPLEKALGKLDDNNAAGEIYLTDVPGKIAEAGGSIVCVRAERLEEALGVNDRRHLEFAEKLPNLREAEGELYRADEIYRSIVSMKSWPASHAEDWKRLVGDSEDL